MVQAIYSAYGLADVEGKCLPYRQFSLNSKSAVREFSPGPYKSAKRVENRFWSLSGQSQAGIRCED